MEINEKLLPGVYDGLQLAAQHQLDIVDQAVAITNATEYQAMISRQKEVKNFIKNVEEECRPTITKAHELHKKLVADMNKLLKPAKEALPKINKLLGDYDTKLKLERQRVLEEQRLAAIKAEAIIRKEMEDKQLEQAQALADSGQHEEAERMLNQKIRPVIVNVPAVIEEPKAEGVHFRENWKAVMVAVDIEDVDPRFVTKCFDQKGADAYAKAHKGGAEARGVKFYCEKTAVTR